ncbi:MAG: hypothetical protein ACFFEV_01280 [Candidatus Thorarchaeota archaeon]
MSDAEGELVSKYATVIMALATLIPPFMTIFHGLSGHDGHLTGVSVTTYALFWAIYPPTSSPSGLQVMTYYSLSAGLPLGFFNIIFAFQVIRFIRGRSSKRKTLVVGALTFVIPIISLIIALPAMISFGVFVYIGPIPIQLAIGLILMHFAGPKEVTSPW